MVSMESVYFAKFEVSFGNKFQYIGLKNIQEQRQAKPQKEMKLQENVKYILLLK